MVRGPSKQKQNAALSLSQLKEQLDAAETACIRAIGRSSDRVSRTAAAKSAAQAAYEEALVRSKDVSEIVKNSIAADLQSNQLSLQVKKEQLESATRLPHIAASSVDHPFTVNEEPESRLSAYLGIQNEALEDMLVDEDAGKAGCEMGPSRIDLEDLGSDLSDLPPDFTLRDTSMDVDSEAERGSSGPSSLQNEAAQMQVTSHAPLNGEEPVASCETPDDINGVKSASGLEEVHADNTSLKSEPKEIEGREDVDVLARDQDTWSLFGAPAEAELYSFQMPDIKAEDIVVQLKEHDVFEELSDFRTLLEAVLQADAVVKKWQAEKAGIEERQMELLLGLKGADAYKVLEAIRRGVKDVLNIDTVVSSSLRRWRNARRRLVQSAEAEVGKFKQELATLALEMERSRALGERLIAEKEVGDQEGILEHNRKKAYEKKEKRTADVLARVSFVEDLIKEHAMGKDEPNDEQSDDEEDEEDLEKPEVDLEQAGKKRKRGTDEEGGGGGRGGSRAETRYATMSDAKKSEKIASLKKTYDLYLKKGDLKILNDTFRSHVRKYQEILPEASYHSRELTLWILTTNKGQRRCVFHDKYPAKKEHDSVIDFKGVGHTPHATAQSKEELVAPEKGHLHCGCSENEAILDFFMWKTARARSTNPQVDRSLSRMPNRSNWFHMPTQIQDPIRRAFWHESIRNLTGLTNMDLVEDDFGTGNYAERIALWQLHTQISRLNSMGVKVDAVFAGEETEMEETERGPLETAVSTSDKGEGTATANEGKRNDKGKGKATADSPKKSHKTSDAELMYAGMKTRAVAPLFMKDMKD